MDMENKPDLVSKPQWPQPYVPKRLFDLTGADAAFAVCAVIICVFTAILGIFGGFALGYSVSAVCMLCLFVIYFAKGGKICVFSIACGVLAFANAAVFLCTTNGSVRLFGVLVSFFLSLVCLDGIVNGGVKGNRRTMGLFYRAAATVGNVDIAVKSLFSDRNGNKKTIGKVLIGLLCAVPVLLVVIPLLLSSDDAFRGMMDRMFTDSGSTAGKGIFGIALSVFAVSYGFSLKAGRTVKEKEGKFAGIENVYIVSFLSAISLCYLLYLFSQLAYFFSAFKGFLPDEEMTYAQYARKGFFEMCVIAVINLALVFAALLLAKKHNGKVCNAIKLLATFVAGFTLIIIATAISKMVLYIGVYGMTVLRLTTSAFMVFLSVVFISVILRVYILRINIVKTALIAAGCIVLVLGTANVNRVCAQYNYDSYCNGKLISIDVEAMYTLGDEGIPYVVKLTSDKNPVVAQKAKRYLAKAYLQDYFDTVDNSHPFTVEQLRKTEKDNGFFAFSLPRAAAYDSLYRYLREHPDYNGYSKN